jgi:hypothetical protein
MGYREVAKAAGAVIRANHEKVITTKKTWEIS